MPAATTKADLLAVTVKEYDKLAALIADLPVSLAMTKDDDETSIKDVIGHRAHWIELFLGWWHDGQKGLEVQFPAPGYKWNELKRYNADLRNRQADLDWQGAVDLLRARHEDLLALLHRLDDDALYGGPMKGAQSAWTAGRFAEASGPSHYRSAAKYIRARKRAAG